jgi:hypothetical protein
MFADSRSYRVTKHMKTVTHTPENTKWNKSFARRATMAGAGRECSGHPIGGFALTIEYIQHGF